MHSHTPTTPFGRRSLMLAHLASRIASPEKLPHNKRFVGNGAGWETEVAFHFNPLPLAVRSEEFEFQSLVPSRQNGRTNFLDPVLVRAVRRLQSRSPTRTGGG